MSDEDTKPLLSEEESQTSRSTRSRRMSPTSQVRHLLKLQRKPRYITNGNGYGDDELSGDQINISASNSTNELGEDPPDDIVSVFIVEFDIKTGNMMEWYLPEDCDMQGVEFKAMPSGAHTVTSDFLYFKKGNLYGVSCYEKMKLDSQEERGVRMKSVGILATSYTMLHKHLPFLEQQVGHQLQTPGTYQQLAAFYEDKKGLLPLSVTNDNESAQTKAIVSNPGSDENDFPDMTITHPVGCFLHFIRFFGEQVMILWKLTLLQKRILFFSPPPIGVVCYRVYCTSCLARHSFKKQARKNSKPYFYVNIADIEYLETEMSYIACTTEKIFEEKPHLYDVYVDNRVIKSSNPDFKDVLTINRSDTEKYQQLLNHRQEHLYLDKIGEAEHRNEEQMFISFFSEQNNRLFSTLFDISSSDNRTLTSEHMQAMGLDPVGDRQFILMVLALYDIDVLMVIDTPCCPI